MCCWYHVWKRNVLTSNTMCEWKTCDWNVGSWFSSVLDENVSILTKTPHFLLYTPSTIIKLWVCMFYPQCKQGIVYMSCIYWRNLNGCIEKYLARLTLIQCFHWEVICLSHNNSTSYTWKLLRSGLGLCCRVHTGQHSSSGQLLYSLTRHLCLQLSLTQS